MALGHGPQILNELNTAKLTGKPSEGFIEDLPLIFYPEITTELRLFFCMVGPEAELF